MNFSSILFFSRHDSVVKTNYCKTFEVGYFTTVHQWCKNNPRGYDLSPLVLTSAVHIFGFISHTHRKISQYINAFAVVMKLR